MTNKDTTSSHYVNNEELYKAIKIWLVTCQEAEDNELPRPKVTEYIGDKIMKIAIGMSTRYNFGNYTFRDQFPSAGIEHCIRYAHKFDAINYKSPFNYFSQICWQACVRVIQKEDRQWKTKLRYTMNAGVDDLITEMQSHDSGQKYDNDYLSFLQKLNDDKDIDLTVDAKKKRGPRTSKNSLEEYFDTDED